MGSSLPPVLEPDVSSPAVKLARRGGRGLLVALFASYLVLLAWVVLWKLEVPYFGGVNREITLIPFSTGQDGGVKAPFELAVNVVIFVPFGLYLGFLAPAWKWWTVAGVIAGASLILEAAQYTLALGSCDITDVILNTAGGMAGFGLLALARRLLRGRTVTVMPRVFGIGTALTLVAIAIFIASPIHYAPARDRAPLQDGDIWVGDRP